MAQPIFDNLYSVMYRNMLDRYHLYIFMLSYAFHKITIPKFMESAYTVQFFVYKILLATLLAN